MDVLDDLSEDARQVRLVNPWLTYGEPFHLLREFGSCVKELDLIDGKECFWTLQSHLLVFDKY